MAKKATSKPKAPVAEGLDPRLADFRNFLYLVWKHLGLPDPEPVQYDIADFMQHGGQNIVIEAFRGVGKSYINVAFACWCLLRNPDFKILVVSASRDKAAEFSTLCFRLICEMPILRHLTPRDEQRSSKTSFDVNGSTASIAPSLKCVGITGQLTGSRADLIISDDVETPHNSNTSLMREQLSEAIKEYVAIIKPGGRIIFLGTPQTEQSIYNLLPERGYTIRIWPIIKPGESQEQLYGDRLAKMVKDLPGGPGTLVCPSRFNQDEVLRRQIEYGRSGFQLQFMLDTRLSDQNRYPLKLSDLVVMDLNKDVGPERVVWAADKHGSVEDIPNVGFNGDRYYKPMAVIGSWIPYTGAVMAIDPSGKGSDETAYAVIKMLNGQLFLVDAGGLGDGYSPTTMQALADIAKLNAVKAIVVEENFGGGMFAQLLKPYLMATYPVTVEEVRHNRQKEMRIIDTLEPVMNNHKLIVDKSLIRKDFESRQPSDDAASNGVLYGLFYQMSRMTRERGALAHDDRIDVLAMAVAYWTEQMAHDVERDMASHKARLLDKDLRDFVHGHQILRPKAKESSGFGRVHRWHTR